MQRRSFHLRPEGEKAFGYAQAVQAGDRLYVSGALAVDDTWATVGVGDMTEQLRVVYATLKTTLDAFGIGFGAVLKETVFVTDMDAFLGANGVRLTVYEGLDLPAVTAVEVRRLAFPDNLVEIELVALV
jgi:2-iminobutanoate/2-iminopropanoate deaminase